MIIFLNKKLSISQPTTIYDNRKTINAPPLTYSDVLASTNPRSFAGQSAGTDYRSLMKA